MIKMEDFTDGIETLENKIIILLKTLSVQEDH